MKALPLSDRILFAVSSQRHSARSLARLYRQDVQTIYKVLAGLENQGLVQRDEAQAAAVFELAEDAKVEYRPGRLIVELDGDDPRTDSGGEDDGRCTAVTTRGTRCKMRVLADGLCSHHAP